jgi:hypothetical protein
MVFRTRVIVRLGTQNRMVTKGYRKGVYDRVTLANVGAGVLARAAVQELIWFRGSLEGRKTSRDR